tara:strand:- start:279 stop:1184 length:906 start_codon:yes stop_codon:yes gene_type:complete
MAISYQQLLPRQTMAATAETFQISGSIPTNAGIESLIFKVDALQSGATDSTDLVISDKLDLITLTSSTVKTEINNSDLTRFNQRVWNSPPNSLVGESDNQGLSSHNSMYLNPITVNGNICFDENYGANPGAIRQISILTAADGTAIDNCFLTVYAVTNTSKQNTRGYTQFKRKVRTCVAGAFEDDLISDLNSYMGYGSFITTGVKDSATAVPAGMTIRGLQLVGPNGAVMDQVSANTLVSGGVRYMTDTNGATVTTVSNYDWIYLDFGIRTGGRPISGASFMRVEEGVADLRRSYHCGLGF